MARGWESKAIEEQQSAREQASSVRGPELSAEDTTRAQRVASLQLARARVLSDLQQACRAPHRAMLETALADIEAQLAEGGPSSDEVQRR